MNKTIETLFFNPIYKNVLIENLKHKNKWIQIITKFLLFVIGGIAFGAYFTGALGFQLIEHDSMRQDLLVASTSLALFFGTALVASLGLVNFINKKFGPKIGTLFCLIVLIIALFALTSMILASVAYNKYS